MTVMTMPAAAIPNYQDVARRYADAWNAHDVGAIMAMHSDDTHYHLHGEVEVHRGRKAVTDKFTTQLKQVPDIHFALKSLHGSGDHFVFEAVITYTRNGEKARFDGIDLMTIRDGLVVSKNSYMVKAE
ncbi:nuclear transport factor 2 family protein [Bradyrhizobium sp. AUGA SZCCT0431]|uniref:nuclear transport factor 2 family protein n=1 Tax=Bradyrhizobium sp. AUGA SZCCT0431 TaxID=2807674 RepID=UPI001BA6B40F|nr:nuclear transport factor 2 family protein [Bradyrhizobium sp. AUGA SZCCT0431]MBR1145698.1 nuclear transport factor 2 family protein [Bradyrhizobium sp. AUGA SZCCT0431]